VTVIPTDGLLPESVEGGTTDDFVQLWPHRHGTDAMFAAYLRRWISRLKGWSPLMVTARPLAVTLDRLDERSRCLACRAAAGGPERRRGSDRALGGKPVIAPTRSSRT
jgi:hypothetical protein